MLQATGTPPQVPSVLGNPPKLLDLFRDAALEHGHTEAWAAEAADWCRQFILFHGKRHPKDMGIVEIRRFLEQLAKTAKDALRPWTPRSGAGILV